MSAFICNDYHISVLATFCVENAPFYILFRGKNECLVPSFTEGFEARATAIEIGRILAKENRRSVNFRYDEKYSTKFVYRTVDMSLYSPNDIIAAAQCLDYQSCERPDYYRSKAKAIINEIILAAAMKLSTNGVWELSHPGETSE